MAAFPQEAGFMGVRTARANVDAVADTVANDQVVWTNDLGVSVRVTKTEFISEDAVTGLVTNHFTLGIVNKGSGGAGTTVVSPQLAFDNGVDLVAFVPKDLPVSATKADVVVDDGETLAFSKVVVGSDIALPAGQVVIHYEHIGRGTT